MPEGRGIVLLGPKWRFPAPPALPPYVSWNRYGRCEFTSIPLGQVAAAATNESACFGPPPLPSRRLIGQAPGWRHPQSSISLPLCLRHCGRCVFKTRGVYREYVGILAGRSFVALFFFFSLCIVASSGRWLLQQHWILFCEIGLGCKDLGFLGYFVD